MGEADATDLGNNSIDGAVTVEETTKTIRNIAKIVSMEVSQADICRHWIVLTLPSDRSRLSDGDQRYAPSRCFKPRQH
jgi:hypothetical protein